jgi:hypothetical protein
MAEPIVHDAFLIGGDWVAPRGTGTIEVINPSTEELFGRVPEGTVADIDAAVAAARRAFDSGPWAEMGAKERGAVLAAVSGAMQADMQGLAELISGEMGSPVSWAVMGQVFAATMIADQYVGLADTYEFTDVRAGMLGPSEVRKVPYGVVAAIVPWNVPLFEAIIKLAPALVAGCTVVLKPAPETPLSAQALGQILQDAGLPAGVFNLVLRRGPGGGRGHRHPPRRRHGQLHRLHPRRHPGRRAGRPHGASAPSPSSWAASRPTSSSTTWRARPRHRRCARASAPPTSTRARPAPPSPACSCPPTSTTPSSTSSRRGRERVHGRRPGGERRPPSAR